MEASCERSVFYCLCSWFGGLPPAQHPANLQLHPKLPEQCCGCFIYPVANSLIEEGMSELERIDMKTALTHWLSTPIKYTM